MGYVIAFAIGAVLGSAVFCFGMLMGRSKPTAQQPAEKPLTEEEKIAIDRRNEYDRQY